VGQSESHGYQYESHNSPEDRHEEDSSHLIKCVTSMNDLQGLDRLGRYKDSFDGVRRTRMPVVWSSTYWLRFDLWESCPDELHSRNF
jgi:hypothetical protein